MTICRSPVRLQGKKKQILCPLITHDVLHILIRHNIYFYSTVHAWWRHQMETFPRYCPFSADNSPFIGEFPSQRTVKWNFDFLFDLHLNKQLSKQSRRWRFETPSGSWWRHCNVTLAVGDKEPEPFMPQLILYAFHELATHQQPSCWQNYPKLFSAYEQEESNCL